MIKRLPIIPTIFVVAAAAVMVWLGFWQLSRADEKAELIEQYQTVSQNSDMTDHPSAFDLFRKSTFECTEVLSFRSTAGRSEQGQTGYVHIAQCITDDWDTYDQDGWGQRETPSYEAEVAIGWSLEPSPPDWDGGSVTGVIGPGGELDWRLIADPPLADLAQVAKPDPKDLPNNHLAYAGQWFFFALTALIIYWLAVRSRMAKRD